MKKIISLFLSVLMLLSTAALIASCGQPADTTVSDTQETVEAPDDPDWEKLEDNDETKQGETVLSLTFDNVDDPSAELPEGFSYQNLENWELVKGSDGYLQSKTDTVRLDISDTKNVLAQKSFTLEFDVTFDSFRTGDTVGAPVSLITWTPKASGKAIAFHWSVKLDDHGYVYIDSEKTSTGIKLETGKRYSISTLFDIENKAIQVSIDGKSVAVKSFENKKTPDTSDIRILNSDLPIKIHGLKVYRNDATLTLGDATRDVFAAMKDSPKPSLYFVGQTDKDPLSYAVGEEMNFDIYFLCNGEVVSAPYFHYSIKGEDGQKETAGYVDGSKGHFSVKAKLSKPGVLRLTVYACDENKQKYTKDNSSFYVDLATTTPQKTDVNFIGGAIAGLEQIEAGGKIPSDFAEYWDGIVADCYKGDIKLLRFEELDPAKHGGNSSYKLYLVEIECAGGFATGYLTYPKNASKLSLSIKFVSYGNTKKPTPSFTPNTATFSVCAHSYHLDDPNAAVQEKYGFDNSENQNRDTVYFKNMMIRNITAARFLKAYIGSSSYGKIVFEGKTVSPIGKWSKGDKFAASGGSQAGFQSVAITALDLDVTEASLGLPWFCDIGGPNIGRFRGTFKPAYTDALMYYDSVAFASLIGKNVTVTVSAGLGDTTSEPSGIIALYNALDCNKALTVYQNRRHTYNPPTMASFKVTNIK